MTPIDLESENCSNITEQPVDICSSVSVEITSTEYQSCVSKTGSAVEETDEKSDTIISDLTKSSDTTFSDTNNCESLTSSVSTPDTVVSKIPKRKTQQSRIPISPARVIAVNNNNNNQNHHNNNNKENLKETKLPKSKIPHKNGKPKQKVRYVQFFDR